MKIDDWIFLFASHFGEVFLSILHFNTGITLPFLPKYQTYVNDLSKKLIEAQIKFFSEDFTSSYLLSLSIKIKEFVIDLTAFMKWAG